MPLFSVHTKQSRQVIDITDDVSARLGEMGTRTGLCHLFVQHTTAALTIMDLDPGTDRDLLNALEAMMPKLDYRHAHDPSHVPSHILSALIGPSLTLPVQEGRLALGTWQRIVLVELDGPRERQVSIMAVGA